MFIKFVTICFILTLKYNKSNAIIDPRHAVREFSARQMGRSIAKCFGQDEVVKCLENEMMLSLDTAIQNNETWQLSDIIVLEKNPNVTPKDYEKLQNLSQKQRSLDDSLGVKLLQLAQSRSLKLQLPTGLTTALLDKRGISSSVDDFNSVSEAETFPKDEGTQRILNGLVDDKIELISSERKKPFKQKPSNSSPLTTAYNKRKKNSKGRKKKDKDKNMAMMGGMAMMGLVAQMFLGKVILIAGAAFVMAKIALLVSVLGSLKKGSSGSSGSTEHVIVTSGGGGGGGGHSHEHTSSGWHRSLPYKHNMLETPGTYNELIDSDEELKRRQSQPQFI